MRYFKTQTPKISDNGRPQIDAEDKKLRRLLGHDDEEDIESPKTLAEYKEDEIVYVDLLLDLEDITMVENSEIFVGRPCAEVFHRLAGWISTNSKFSTVAYAMEQYEKQRK